MKLEDQILAIAAACGWIPDPVWASVRTPTHCVFKKGDELRTTKELPDWLNDLNAIRDAEVLLGLHEGQHARRFGWLLYQIIYPTDKPMTHDEWLEAGNELSDWSLSVGLIATAANRCEGVLRCIGKWRDE